jgi:hypothetical protein
MTIFLADSWFGEGGSMSLAKWAVASCATAVAIVWRLTRGDRAVLRVLAMSACAALGAAGFVTGDHEHTRAYNECVRHGEEIRAQLSAYRQREGHYPDRLDRAVDQKRLCNRTLRGSILWYSATASTYQLEFGDDLVTFRAGEDLPTREALSWTASNPHHRHDQLPPVRRPAVLP